MRIANAKLSADDRFFSLIEYYARAQDSVLRERVGLPLQCSVYTAHGTDLTGTLHSRGSSYLDDNERGSGCAAGCLLLSFRRRFPASVLPGALVWAFAFAFLVAVVGVRVDVVIVVALGALAVQAVVLWYAGPPKVTARAHEDALAVPADVAERLQRRLLPAVPPELAGLDIAFTYRSASTGVLSGGDFLDYYTRPPSGSLAFAIGDVAGKGVDAMATTFVDQVHAARRRARRPALLADAPRRSPAGTA